MRYRTDDLPGVVDPMAAAAAVAVLRGARTVREVGDAIGRGSARTLTILRRARRLDLVSFEDGRAGTLRPRLAVVASDLGPR